MILHIAVRGFTHINARVVLANFSVFVQAYAFMSMFADAWAFSWVDKCTSAGVYSHAFVETPVPMCRCTIKSVHVDRY